MSKPEHTSVESVLDVVGPEVSANLRDEYWTREIMSREQPFLARRVVSGYQKDVERLCMATELGFNPISAGKDYLTRLHSIYASLLGEIVVVTNVWSLIPANDRKWPVPLYNKVVRGMFNGFSQACWYDLPHNVVEKPTHKQLMSVRQGLAPEALLADVCVGELVELPGADGPGAHHQLLVTETYEEARVPLAHGYPEVYYPYQLQLLS